MSKFRKSKKTDDKGAPRWMVTFSDLFMLILVFFILLFSMSQIDLVKFKAVAESFKQVNLLDYHPSAIPFEHPTDFSIDYESTNNNNSNYGEEHTEDQLEEVLREVQQFLDENELEDIVVANRTERGVVLVLEEQILFNSGEASILPVAYPFLNKLGNLLERIPNLVKIEGHTDTVPMNNYQYPSNWELSTARASSVIRHLIDEHDLSAERFIAVGYGETRPIVPNTTRENMQKNRRVEIVISDPASVEEIDY